MPPIEFETPDKLEYYFFPAGPQGVVFRVRSAHDAHLALTSSEAESDPMLEVFIGGWNNSKSVVRKNRTKPDVAEADTPQFLSAGEFRGFWIRWTDNVLTVGKEGEAAAFLSYNITEPFPIRFVGFCTGWGASGSWIVEAPQAGGSAVWVGTSGGDIPAGAFVGGEDSGEPLYVGRAQHEGALLPGTGGVPPKSDLSRFLDMESNRQGNSPVQPPPFAASTGSVGIPSAWMFNSPSNLPIETPNPQMPAPPIGFKDSVSGSTVPDQPTAQGIPIQPTPVPVNPWVKAHKGSVPTGAFVGGEEENGEPLYVGRAEHEGSLTPGKVNKSHGVCYIAWGCKEHGKESYEVFVGTGNWIVGKGAEIPQNAIEGGRSENGEVLYIGRVRHDGTITIGKVQPSHGVCYVSFGGFELKFSDFEILVA